MKNKIYTVPLLSTLLATLLFISACTQDPIFYDIELEIPLEEAKIQGNVLSIVKLKGNLYTANGKVYTKGLKTVRDWEEMSKPTGNVVQLASDATHLYALVAEQTDGDDEKYSYAVWVLLDGTGTDWEKVVGASLDNVAKEKSVVLFDNAVIGDETTTGARKAYVRVDEKVYPLTGTGLSTEITAGTKGSSTKTIAAAKLVGGDDYFADTRAFCADATKAYLYRAKADGNIIEYSTDGTTWTDSVTVDADPLSFAFTTGKLIVGTNDGLQQVTLNSSGVPAGASNLGGNAEATIGESEIFSVASFGTVDGNAIYAGASKRQNSKYNALWGYYPSRGDWNYE